MTAEQVRALDAVPAGTASTVSPVLSAKTGGVDLESYAERFGGDEGA